MLAANWVAMPFVWFLCPETTGKSLEHIDLLFAQPHVRERLLAEQSLGSSEDEKKERGGDGSVRIEQVV